MFTHVYKCVLKLEIVNDINKKKILQKIFNMCIIKQKFNINEKQNIL
jgi:hypothetical protein